MAGFTALIDSSVLYSNIVTDLIIETAKTGTFRARWTAQIHEEWMGALLDKRTDLTRTQLLRRRDLMDKAVLDCLITGYEQLIPGLSLPDLNDRHILAAAIVGKADVIVTYNLKDFPKEALVPFEIEVQDPDTFLVHQRSLDEERFLEIVRRIRQRLKAQPKSADQYLEGLEKAGLVILASELRKVRSLL